jgi:hypothetical protein
MKRSDQLHRKEQRRISAKARAESYALLTVGDKIAKAHKNGGRECKEYVRLYNKVIASSMIK